MDANRARSGIRILGRVVRIILVTWLSLCLLIAAFQRKLMYFPTRAPEQTMLTAAAAEGLEAWRTPEGKLIGWRTARADQPARVRFMVTHGNAGAALQRVYLARLFQSVIASEVFLLEYPGYGSREGAPGQEAFLGAAGSALRALREESKTPIVLVGESIGGGVAAGLAHRQPEAIAGVILLTPFDSLAAVAGSHYPYLPVRLLLRDRYPVDEWLRQFHGPVAVLLAEDDEVVPMESSRRLYDGYAGPKKLWVQPGAGHNTMDYTPGSPWAREAIDFLQSVGGSVGFERGPHGGERGGAIKPDLE